MRPRRLSAPIRKALACAGVFCGFLLMVCLHRLYMQWHARDVWMWIDCADSPRVRQALDMGCNPDVRGPQGFPALCTASAVGSVQTTQLLLNYHANPNLANLDGETALMFATRFTNDPSRGDSGRYIAIVRALVEHHANINLKNHRGETALTLACRSGSLENVQYLVEHGADINLAGGEDTKPLIAAAFYHHTEIFHYLLQHGAR